MHGRTHTPSASTSQIQQCGSNVASWEVLSRTLLFVPCQSQCASGHQWQVRHLSHLVGVLVVLAASALRRVENVACRFKHCFSASVGSGIRDDFHLWDGVWGGYEKYVCEVAESQSHQSCVSSHSSGMGAPSNMNSLQQKCIPRRFRASWRGST